MSQCNDVTKIWETVPDSLVTLSLIAAGCMPDSRTMRAAPCIAEGSKR